MVNRFILNEVSYFGPGARKELPGVIARLGFKKAMIVTDKGLIQYGVAKMVSAPQTAAFDTIQGAYSPWRRQPSRRSCLHQLRVPGVYYRHKGCVPQRSADAREA